ncbi:MAG: M1 family aminopeptidase [Cystobacter sp.]
MSALGTSATGCTAADGGDESLNPQTQPGRIDVEPGDLPAHPQRYHYSFNLATREAQSKLFFDVAPPGGNCLTLDAPSALTDVRWNANTPQCVSPSAGTLRVCDRPLFAGQVMLESRFTVPEQTYDFSPVGFSRTQDRSGNTFSYLLNWVEQCDRFGPCNDEPGLLSRFVLEVTHAAGEVTLCPGKRTEVNATTTRCELMETPAPTYSSFAIASNKKWKRSQWLDVDGTKLVFFEVPEGRLAASLSKSDMTDYVRWITSELGPLPYGKELRIAGGPTRWLGVEHPANIILREDLPELPAREYANMTRHTLMHEIVHQWAGNHITLANAYDFAWKEAIAEYLTYLYESQRWPADAAQTRAYWDRLGRTALYYPRPLDTPPFLSYAMETYGSGSMTLFVQLEDLLPGGQATLLRAIKAFLSGPPGIRGVEELKAELERASGQDLTDYFNAWVYGVGEADWPTFNVTTAQADGQLRLDVTQTTFFSGKTYPVNVTLRVRGATRTVNVPVNFGLHPTQATTTVTLPFDEEVVSVSVDPENRVISWNRSTLLPLEDEAPRGWIY